MDDTTNLTRVNRDSGRNVLGPYGVIYRTAIERIPNTTATALYALLITYAHDGLAWPHQMTLAETLDISERTVIRELQTLIKAGLIAKRPRLDRGRKVGSEYLILAPEVTPMSPPTEVTPMSRTEVTPMSLPIPYEQSLEHSASRRVNPRPRDLLFDAICDVCSYDVNALTKTESGRVARAAAELRQLSPPAEPEDVLTFGRSWAQTSRYRCTPQAITGNWQRIMSADRAAQRAERRRRNDMGVA